MTGTISSEYDTSKKIRRNGFMTIIMFDDHETFVGADAYIGPAVQGIIDGSSWTNAPSAGGVARDAENGRGKWKNDSFVNIHPL